MQTLDDIKASKPTLMTAELMRLFAFAGCRPTACHACLKKINVGDRFQLIPHRRDESLPYNDEMVCDKHGEADLVLRDKRDVRAEAAKMRLYSQSPFGRGGYTGGFSRPSKI